jgi:hypothetical protein
MGDLAQKVPKPENDLSSLACDAAIDLDNLIKGKSEHLDNVKDLIDAISAVGEGLSESARHGVLSYLSPSTAVGLFFAGAESGFFNTQTDLSGLSEKTNEIIKNLIELVQDPPKAVKEALDTVEKLRSFCLSFSRHELDSKPTLYEAESQHPYRR